MFHAACRPLLSGAAASTSALGPSVCSRLTIQTRNASVQKAFKNVGPGRRQKEKPVREKVAGSFLPLPANQVQSTVGEISTELEELPTISKGAYPSKYVGKAVRFPATDATMMKAFGLPRNVFVDFRLLSMPCAVTRRVTQSIVARLDSAFKGSSPDERLIMTGSSGCGKSYLMLQAVSYALANDWIVLYIPRAHKLVDSSTAYFYDHRTRMYLQPTASNQILQRLLTVNRKILDQVKVTKEVVFEKRNSVSVGESLRALITVATSEQHLAPMVLSAVLEELGKQEKFPVLLAVDEFQALYCKTEYRNQHFEHVKSYHLSLPRLLMEYASGKKTLKRGAFFGAVSSSLTQYPLSPELQQALTADQQYKPYSKFLPGMLEYTKGLRTFPVPDKLEHKEAAAMFEIWMKDRALHSDAADELFLSKYSESAGNARDFVHGGLLATLTS